jgi:signal transduction histidine kinase
MGSRGRSIRLRIYFLVAIPLIAMAGLLAYVVGTSVNNAISVDRVPNLINAAGIPAAKFGVFVESERAAAVIYLSKPTAANLAAYRAAITATDKAEPAFTAAMTSPAVVVTESASGAKQIQVIFKGLKQLPTLRKAIQARVISPLDALGFYTQGLTATTKLFLIQTESVVPTDQLGPAVGLIDTVQSREELSQEHALLAGILAGRRMTLADRVAFTNMAAARQANLNDAVNLLGPAALAAYNAPKAGSAAMQQDLTNVEQAIAAGTRVTKLPVTPAQWQHLAGTLLTEDFNGGVAVSQAILVADHKIGHAAWVRVAAVSVVGLLGLLLTILVTTLVARSIIRRLGGLERNALQLAENQLPDVVGRLRRGDQVDVNAEAPPLRVGRDEIGRVGQAFDLVRQTAIRAAVEEARLRQGLNDVFRSLARRSQSLLHRQLTLLDQMERRASDPEALDDLFRLDHLTTRMRRHAEGLVILAGAPPGRAWSSPVRMVDVMRGAIAEVEDYARVSVATRSQAALAGSAVADVIHLLAELIENATTLSPPYTSVRVSGDTVANGFAIEVEDRGLGMSPERLAELNERLANPPEFNPSDSEQLGLFVVSQLAKRHGIRVTLKGSPYGGTAAIVLIPRHLVVTEEAFRSGLPGEPAMAQLTANGNHAGPPAPAVSAGVAGPGSGSGFSELDGVPGLGLPPGVRISGPLRRSQGIIPGRPGRGAHAAPAPAPAPAPALGAANGAAGHGPAGHGPDDLPGRHGQPGGAGQAPPSFGGAAPYPDQPAPFPGWTLHNKPGASGPPWEIASETGPPPGMPGSAAPGAPSRSGGPSGPGTDRDIKGLPRRVKQASLAPQLRDNPPPRRTTLASSGPHGGGPGSVASPPGAPGSAASSGPSPAEIRQTMSALQRGWQEGRSRRAAEQAAGEPAGSGPGAPAGAGPGAAPADDSSANEEARGDPHGL